MTDLRSLTLTQLAALCARLGWEPYRAKQIYSWLWQKAATDIDAFTNLSKEKRAMLAQDHFIAALKLEKTLRDRDGTTKYAWRLADGRIVESVFIPEPDRGTVCVSTQIGCALGCCFCATGVRGFVRNLAWHEIAGQVLEVRSIVQGAKGQRGKETERQSDGVRTLEPWVPRSLSTAPSVTNVVLMGMGEPFLNYGASVEAVAQMNSDFGLNIGARRITVSTAGIPDAIRRYALFPLQSRLAVSLNAADNETRDRLMPVNRTHRLEEVIAAVREFTATKDKRVTFEYVLIDGVNNRRKDVHQLSRLVRDIPCKVNLIPLNPIPGSNIHPPSAQDIERFRAALYPLLPAVTVRRSRGAGILAACGQLAGQV